MSDTEQRLARINQIIEQADLQNLQREAHGLKGSCRNLGARRMAEICEQLEEQAATQSFQNSTALFAQLENNFTGFQQLLKESGYANLQTV